MAQLERTLSFPALLIITVNSIMGTGIFFLPAVAAREAGPSSLISWLVMSAIAMVVALIFAELVAMYPKAGGIYEYSKQAFGNFTSFFFGWTALIAANVTIAMLVVGAVRYLNPGLPGMMKILISILIVVVFNFMAYRGMQTSIFMLVTFGFITLGTLFSLIIPGFWHFQADLMVPFFTHDWGKVFLAVFLVAETFFGWETATFLAEETKDPERNMPLALWLGTLIIVVITILFVLVSIGSVHWSIMGQAEAPLALLGGMFYGEQAIPIMSILVYLSIIGSVAGWVVAAPRLIMSLAEDKLFIQQLSDIHPIHKTPHKAIIFQTIATCILVVVGSGSYEILLEILVPLVLLMYAGVILAFIVLRVRRPQARRPFRLKGGVVLAGISLIALLAVIGAWIVVSSHAWDLLKLGLSFIGIGIPIYLLLTYFYNPDVLIRTLGWFSRTNRLFEDFLLPKSARQELLSKFPNSAGKRVLEFGAGVGTMTMHLARHVLPGGKLYALDFSEANLQILQDRMKDQPHVEVLCDPHMVNRLHPDITEVDMIVSVGNLSYVQDFPKVLKEMADILPERGKVCFLEYKDFFFILPDNPRWLDKPDVIRAMFNDAGFSVQVSVKKGLLWNYLYIYGIKERRDVPYI